MNHNFTSSLHKFFCCVFTFGDQWPCVCLHIGAHLECQGALYEKNWQIYRQSYFNTGSMEGLEFIVLDKNMTANILCYIKPMLKGTKYFFVFLNVICPDSCRSDHINNTQISSFAWEVNMCNTDPVVKIEMQMSPYKHHDCYHHCLLRSDIIVEQGLGMQILFIPINIEIKYYQCVIELHKFCTLVHIKTWTVLIHH